MDTHLREMIISFTPEDGLKIVPITPEDVKSESTIKYSVNNIPGKVETRVFIGGNYDNIAVLREIAMMVTELGYQPIIPLNFEDIPQEEISSFDVRLLAVCKYAIFEVSISDGHLIEIVRAQDFNVQTFLVYQVRDEKKIPPSGASSMILTTAFPRFGYRTFHELRDQLQNFLPSRV